LKTDIFRFLLQRPDVKFNRKLFVFTLCLIISCFTWLQINLSKTYTDAIPVRIEFVNLPKAKLGITKKTDRILVEVEADGYALLKYKEKDMQIDFRKIKKDANGGSYYFAPNSNLKAIARQMDDNFKVIRVTTDTIVLSAKTK
jgi:hypothetical protein